MNDRYDQFKAEQEAGRDTGRKVARAALKAAVGAGAGLTALSVARIAMNPLSPFNFIRTPIAVISATVAVAAAVALKKCDEDAPCP